jgi:hypothetical protein
MDYYFILRDTCLFYNLTTVLMDLADNYLLITPSYLFSFLYTSIFLFDSYVIGFLVESPTEAI